MTYQWTATTISTGRVNAEKVMPVTPGSQKRARSKLMPLDIWRQFFTNEIIADILLYINNKLSNIRSELPDEILQNGKCSHINIITESELLAFLVYVCQGIA